MTRQGRKFAFVRLFVNVVSIRLIFSWWIIDIIWRDLWTTPVENEAKKLHPQWTDRLHSFLEFNIIDLLSFTISSSPSAVNRSESRTRENYSRQRSLVCGLDRSVFCAVDNFTKFDIFSRDLNRLIRYFDLEFPFMGSKNLIFAVGSVWESFCSRNFYMIFRSRAYLPAVDSYVVIYCTWDV